MRFRPLELGRLSVKCDCTRAETRFRLSAKRTSPFKSAGASVQSTAGSRGVRISGSNAGYAMFRGSVKSTGYPLRSPVSPSLSLPCVTVCHRISTGLYYKNRTKHTKTLCGSNASFLNPTAGCTYTTGLHLSGLIETSQSHCDLTHCGRVTQICVCTLQLCKTDDTHLRF